MAFKLTKEEVKQRDEIVEMLRVTWTDLDTAINEYNVEFAKLKAPVEEALAGYNKAAALARSLAFDIHNQAQSDIEEKSERWQESAAGEAAERFRADWEDLDFDELEVTFSEDLTIEDPGYDDALNDAPESAE